MGRCILSRILRLMDIMMAIPSILLSLAIVTVLGPGVRNLTVAVGVGLIPTFARVTRSSVLSAKEQNYVEAARAAGSSDLRILFAHLLPNCASPLIVYSTFYLGTAILTASTLSFLGFGIQPPYAEWGAMASAGRTHFLAAPHVSTFPSLAIFVTILALNLLGDGLRDVLDPRLKD